MFAFANFVLLALFGAAGVDLVLALRAAAPGPGRLRRALGWLWGNEHYLFGDWGGEARAKLGGWLFTAGLVFYEVDVTLCNSLLRIDRPWVQDVLGTALEWLAFCCLAAKLLLGTRCTWRSMGCAGCLYFIARWVYFNSQNIWWIGIVLAVLAAKDAPLRRALRAYAAAGAAVMLLVAALQGVGIITSDYVGYLQNDPRPGFGYGHPNTFGGLVFGVAIAWLLSCRGALRWRHIAMTAAAGLFLLAGPQSSSPALSLLLLAALLAVCRACPRLFAHKVTAWLALVPLAGVLAFSFLLPLRFVKVGPWWSDLAPAWLAAIDDALSGRLAMIWNAYRLLPVKIAGQVLADFPTLDNSYVSAVYQFGPVAAALLCLLIGAALFGYARRRQAVCVCCLVAGLAYAFMEVQIFHLTSDPAALLLAGAVYLLPLKAWPEAGPDLT